MQFIALVLSASKLLTSRLNKQLIIRPKLFLFFLLNQQGKSMFMEAVNLS